jgi:hypothetical protein
VDSEATLRASRLPHLDRTYWDPPSVRFPLVPPLVPDIFITSPSPPPAHSPDSNAPLGQHPFDGTQAASSPTSDGTNLTVYDYRFLSPPEADDPLLDIQAGGDTREVYPVVQSTQPSPRRESIDEPVDSSPDSQPDENAPQPLGSPAGSPPDENAAKPLDNDPKVRRLLNYPRWALQCHMRHTHERAAGCVELEDGGLKWSKLDEAKSEKMHQTLDLIQSELPRLLRNPRCETQWLIVHRPESLNVYAERIRNRFPDAPQEVKP